jgi:hypothetical protein
MKKILFGLLLFVVLCLTAQAAEPVYVFQEKDGSPGKIHGLTQDDMRLHPLPTFWYTESYFFIAYLDSGEIAYLNLLVSNMGLSKNTPALTLTVITPDRKRLTTEQNFSSDDLKLAPEKFSLSIGPNTLAGDDKNLSLNVHQGGLGLELNFNSPAPGFKLGEGVVYFGSKKETFYAINYPAPRSRISGQIIYNGKKVPAKGWGYVDHCWYNANTTDFEQVWHNLKFFSPAQNLLITSYSTPEAYGSKMVALAALVTDEKAAYATTDVKVSEFNREFDQVGQKNYPKRILYEFSGNNFNGKIDFNSSKVTEKMDVLEKLDKGAGNKALKWTINKFVAKPYYYRSVGPAELELARPVAEKVSGMASCEVIFVK